MRRVKFTLVGLVVVLAALVAYGYGCGGDESSGGDTSAAQSGTSAGGDGTSAEGTGAEQDGTGTEGDGTSATSGGDGDGSSAPLTKAQFIKQGDAICSRVPERYGKLTKELEEESKGKKPSQAEINLAAAVPPLPEAAAELEALTPPKGDEGKAEAMVAALEAAAKGLEEQPSAELSGPKSPFAEFQKLTKEYGFKTCSQL